MTVSPHSVPTAVAALVLGLVASLLVAAAVPAAASSHVQLTNPGSGATISEATTVRVQVDARALERVDAVEVRLRRNGETVGATTQLSHSEGDTRGGTSVWSAGWDPAAGWMGDGQTLGGGSYRLEARARSLVVGSEQATEWSGHGIQLVASVQAPTFQANEQDGQALLEWTVSEGPDFTAYRVQRASGDGGFETITEITDRGATSHRDTPPGSGTWRYRVTAVHGEQTATSQEASVEVDVGGPEESGGGDAEDGPGSDQSASGGGGGSSGRPPLRTGEAPPGSPEEEAGSVPGLAEAAEPEASAPEPDLDDGDGDFDEELPFEAPEADAPSPDSQLDIEAAEAGPRDDAGVLTVAGRDIALADTLPPMAGGLLLFVTAGHVLRLRQQLG